MVVAEARAALQEFSDQRALLVKKSDVVREYVALHFGVPVYELFEEAEEAKLSDSEKATINSLLDQILVEQPDPSNEAVLDLVKARTGVQLDRFDNPPAVIGSMVHHAKKRGERAMNPSQPEAAQILAMPAPTA